MFCLNKDMFFCYCQWNTCGMEKLYFVFMFQLKQDNNMQILFWVGYHICVKIYDNYAIKMLLFNWKANWRKEGFEERCQQIIWIFQRKILKANQPCPLQHSLCMAKTALSPSCTVDVIPHFHYKRGRFWVHSFKMYRHVQMHGIESDL